MSEMEHGPDSPETPDSTESRRADFEAKKNALQEAHDRVIELDQALSNPSVDSHQNELDRKVAAEARHKAYLALKQAVVGMRLKNEFSDADNEEFTDLAAETESVIRR